jgi:phosphate:Na+ symporter
MSDYSSIFQAIGGIGLFLLGMTIMTNGLKELAGRHIRTALMRFTKNPTTGAMTGAVSTMILQSSSATIVAAVGFVGVGMMQFTEALGIIFGANIGTTITGWLVVLFGFKFKLAQIALPLIFLGMVCKLFFRGKIATIGYAVAGFSLIFVGISLMQEGMREFDQFLSLSQLPADTWIGRLQLVGLGIIATLITQSSSAGVAATLTMLFTDLISFEQAAALVIGMDLGTTVTPLLATIGGNTEVKRTGFSHVIYNFFTAIGAFLLITPYIAIWDFFAPHTLSENVEVALVGFHSFFNILGVIVILPFTRYFANFIESLLPSSSIDIYPLDKSLPQNEPKLALMSSQKALEKIFNDLVVYVQDAFNTSEMTPISLHGIERNLQHVQEYMDEIVIVESKAQEWQQFVALLHAVNHLERLLDRCEELEKERKNVKELQSLMQIWKHYFEEHPVAPALFEPMNLSKNVSLSTEVTKRTLEALDSYRDSVILKIAKDEVGSYQAMEILNTIKWYKRLLKHINRFIYYYHDALDTPLKSG